MSTISIRKQTSFRLNEDLLRSLQAEAKRHNRSLNNLVESVLMNFVAQRVNDTTLAAIREAESSDNLETLDLSQFRMKTIHIVFREIIKDIWNVMCKEIPC
ncbi:MAG: toxin-antitoxin system protein [Paramuribaculum sp.]|nr:toxin-antitoxin system protein [Paramuribaculum sp.]